MSYSQWAVRRQGTDLYLMGYDPDNKLWVDVGRFSYSYMKDIQQIADMLNVTA